MRLIATARPISGPIGTLLALCACLVFAGCGDGLSGQYTVYWRRSAIHPGVQVWGQDGVVAARARWGGAVGGEQGGGDVHGQWRHGDRDARQQADGVREVRGGPDTEKVTDLFFALCGTPSASPLDAHAQLAVDLIHKPLGAREPARRDQSARRFTNKRLCGLDASLKVPLECVIDLPESFRDKLNPGVAHSVSLERHLGSLPRGSSLLSRLPEPAIRTATSWRQAVSTSLSSSGSKLSNNAPAISARSCSGRVRASCNTVLAWRLMGRCYHVWARGLWASTPLPRSAASG